MSDAPPESPLDASFVPNVNGIDSLRCGRHESPSTSMLGADSPQSSKKGSYKTLFCSGEKKANLKASTWGSQPPTGEKGSKVSDQGQRADPAR